MKRPVRLAVVGVALLVLLTVPALALATGGDGAPPDRGELPTDDTEDSDRLTADDGRLEQTQANATAPGERLAGTVGVNAVELDGEIDTRAISIQITQAETAQGQADVIRNRTAAVDERVAALEARKAALDDQRAKGDISQIRYRVEIARLAAETKTAATLANRTETATRQLPADVLDERGVEFAAIERLSARANTLSGGDVANIARDIAGPRVGTTPADERPISVPDRPDRAGTPAGDGSPADDGSGAEDNPAAGNNRTDAGNR